MLTLAQAILAIAHMIFRQTNKSSWKEPCRKNITSSNMRIPEVERRRLPTHPTYGRHFKLCTTSHHLMDKDHGVIMMSRLALIQ